MQSETCTIRTIFQHRTQYCVPFFQRQYVWSPAEQWSALWLDIEAKADQRLDGFKPQPHFLGAIVLEPTGQDNLDSVPTSSVIDGQQRLTTLQYILAALSLVARAHECEQRVRTIETFRWNENVFVAPNIEKYKIWPTHPDRKAYVAVMSARSLDDLPQQFPESFTQQLTLRKVGVEHPRPLEGAYYYVDKIEKWITERSATTGYSEEILLNHLAEALLTDMQLVVIRLGANDDAQVIFETLNGRGARLTATDLIRNYVFLKADKEFVAAEEAEGADPEDTPEILYEQTEWKQAQRRGRLSRPRLEWFIQTATTRTLRDEVEMERLYPSFKKLIEGGHCETAVDLLGMLSSAATSYRALLDGEGLSPISEFGRRLSAWETTTVHPLALAVSGSNTISDANKREAFDHLISYIVRRAVCGLTAKNYNNNFLGILRRVEEGDISAERIAQELLSYDGEASRWPRDDEFQNNWLNVDLYERLGSRATAAILVEIENIIRLDRHAEEPFNRRNDHWVEHILPQAWWTYWPLADNSFATGEEVTAVVSAKLGGGVLNERQQHIAARLDCLHKIGNLTLLLDDANRELSNNPFLSKEVDGDTVVIGKKEGLFNFSNLHLNRMLWAKQFWNEQAIEERTGELFEYALRLWPRP